MNARLFDEECLSYILLAIEEHPPQTLQLHGGQFAVVQMSSQAHAHPWAARMPYDTLYETALPRETRSRPQVTLVFESPTAFRSQGRTMLFPLPRLVFGSLMARWNSYAPQPLDAALYSSTRLQSQRKIILTSASQNGSMVC